jgi:hypothetical protein
MLRVWKSLSIKGREREGGRGKREEKIFSAEIVWTAVPPDDRLELKGTLTRDERKESQNDRLDV